MATTVRCFFLDGLVSINGTAVPKMPWLSRSVVDAAGAPQTADAAPAKCTHVLIQVPRDSAVLFDLCPPQFPRDADRNSMLLEAGSHIYPCGPGWLLSFLDNTE